MVQQRPLSRFPHIKRLSDGRDHQVGVAQRSQGHEPGPIDEVLAHLGSHLQAQARFAHASRASQRDEAHVLAQEFLLDGDHFLLSSDERGGLKRQIVGIAV